MPDERPSAPLRGADPRLQRRRPTDEELAKASEISESDLDAAVDAWERVAPNEARKIVEAIPDED
jgi:hypothetical protein